MKRVAIILMMLDSLAHADPIDVHAAAAPHLEQGIRRFDAGDLDGALPELEQAYGLEPGPDVCYALGQVLRKKGQCDRAIGYFRCAVAQSPSEAFTRAAQYQIGRCVVEQPGAIAATTPEVKTERTEIVTQLVSPRIAWWKDPAGGALVGIGVAAAIVGGALFGRAQVLASASATSLDDFHAAGSVPALRIGGDVAFAVAGALVIGGIVRYAVRAKRTPSTNSTPSSTNSTP